MVHTLTVTFPTQALSYRFQGTRSNRSISAASGGTPSVVLNLRIIDIAFLVNKDKKKEDPARLEFATSPNSSPQKEIHIFPLHI
jgi:hypothetical protein